ncbi:MAG TPA: CRISPR-associated RAMP protein Csx7 [Ktedonobacteraceae bacterium]
MTQQSAQANHEQDRPYGLQNRYLFEGKLEMKTALHVGGGKATLSHTDSPVVLTPEGLPFIPGSSFKGTLRSTIEKIVASLPAELGLHSCGLLTQVKGETCATARQKEINDERRARPTSAEALQLKARQSLCHTCRLFGSPFAAARLTINDLYLIDDEWSGTTQIRDGVAIDRDSETARSGLKYDFEVVPSTTVFGLRLVLENATEQDLQLISIGLSEFISGFGGVGGLRSRGLGACILADLQIHFLDLADEQTRKQSLKTYLLRDREKPRSGLAPLVPQVFFEQHIDKLFQESASNS